MNEIRLKMLDLIRDTERTRRIDPFLTDDDHEALEQAQGVMQQALNLILSRVPQEKSTPVPY